MFSRNSSILCVGMGFPYNIQQIFIYLKYCYLAFSFMIGGAEGDFTVI